MIKVLHIELHGSCAGCPYLGKTGDNNLWSICKKFYGEHGRGKVISPSCPIPRIPEWCPLPNG